VGHTYSHHYLRNQDAEVGPSQMDAEREEFLVQSTESVRRSPSPSEDAALNGGDDFDFDDDDSDSDENSYDSDSDYNNEDYKLQEEEMLDQQRLTLSQLPM
jgi:hypothetical protein